MPKGKKLREKGKIRFSDYFQEFEKGDAVSIDRDKSLTVNFLKQLQGRTGIIEGKRGRFYVVKIKDHEEEKKFIVEPVHLKKIKH